MPIGDPLAIEQALPAKPETPLRLGLLADNGHRPKTNQDWVYETVRQAIMRGTVAPGTRLNQSELAAELSMSTTPVREALRRLAGDGLVRIDSYRGAIVRELDKSDLEEVYELRLILEPLATRKAAERITEQELDAAERLWEKMNDPTDADIWVETNRDFHAIFAGAAQSPNLFPILKSLRDHAAPYVRLSITLDGTIPKSSNEEHRQLLDACRRRDGDLAAAIEERHLRATLQAVIGQYP